MLRICGPKLSNCCFILSLWGVIMLVLLGIFFKTKSVALLEDTNKDLKEEAAFSSSAKNCFIGAGNIYTSPTEQGNGRVYSGSKMLKKITEPQSLSISLAQGASWSSLGKNNII